MIIVNLLFIYSCFHRGLLPPKMVVDEFGVGLTDEKGLLGSGIYFGDDITTSIKYSKASEVKGTRILLISDVALGKVRQFTSKQTDLKEAPEGFDSVQGVGRHQDDMSNFQVSHLNNLQKIFLSSLYKSSFNRNFFNFF